MSNFRRNVSSLIVLCLIQIEFSQCMWTKYEITSLKDLNGTTSVIHSDLKMKRTSRTTYGISGTITINDDFEKYMLDIKFYYSASGNGDYILHPLKKSLAPLCDVCNDRYRKYLMKDLSTTSDLPNSEDDICPLFEQKTYTIKDCRLDTKFLPQYLQAGWYKICILIYDLDGIQSSGLEANVHLQ